MAKRINRHLNQRSEMLSGISHDLRTPLTRLKLQLEMIKESEISKKMSKDIDEMENMLNDYLQFAKTQIKENTESMSLSKIFNNIREKMGMKNLMIDIKEEIILSGRKHALERCFSNIVHNGLTYGEKVIVTIQKSSNRAIIKIEDNGPVYLKNIIETFLNHFLD